MKWSTYQQAIFSACENETCSLNIEACAGSGKTTTIVAGTAHLSGSVRVMAFNKSIANTLAQKLPPGVATSTFHSAGFGEIRERMKVGSPNSSKTKDAALARGADYDTAMNISRMVSMAKNFGFYTKLRPEVSKEAWIDLLDHTQVNVPENMTEEQFLSLAVAVFRDVTSDLKSIDFDDMLYIPVAKDWYLTKYDNIVCDEAQDINPIQQEMLARMCGKRMIAVGDSHQAIYGFRGADSKSMDTFARRFNSEVLYLPVSYRCPTKIITLAQQLVPHIQASEEAIEGDIYETNYSEWLGNLGSPSAANMVLCRNNAPLFKLAMHMLLNRIPFNIQGDFADQLLRFVKRFKAKTLQELSVRLRAWYEEESAKLEKQERWGKLAQVEDKYVALRGLLDESSSLDEVLQKLDALIKAVGGVTLSSIHRAKGLEAEHVHLLYPHLIPSKYATTESQLQQEYNLQYVAITRAKQSLTFIQE